MSLLYEDTTQEAENVLLEMIRRAPAWHRLQTLSQANSMARALMTSGLRRRYPCATEGELLRRLADLLLGPELASRAYSTAGKNYGEMQMDVDPFVPILSVTEILERLGIPYLLVGSIAGAIHGIARMTLDADMIAEIHPEHVRPLVRALEGAFYVDPGALSDAVVWRSSFNVVHLESIFKVDVFVSKERPFEKSMMSRRMRQEMGSMPGRYIYVATAEDTLLGKLEWYRIGGEVSDRQWRDVLGILRAGEGTLDVGYMRKWATELGVPDLLDRALAETQNAG